jgi:hypothetical protein
MGLIARYGAEFVKMVMAASLDARPESVFIDAKKGRDCFSDFVGTEQWFWEYACAAKALGFIDGYPDGSFRGTSTVNFAEALKISVRAWDVPEPVYIRAPDHWYDPFFDATNSYTTIFEFLPRSEPGRLLNRGEAAVIIDAFMNQGSFFCDGHTIGDSYKMDCNTCTCTENGSACTKMACIPDEEPVTCTTDSECGIGGHCQRICTQHGESCISFCASTSSASQACSTSDDCAADEWCQTYACAGDNCTGSCQKGVSSKLCMSSSQCGAGEKCTTEDGDCRGVCPLGADCLGPDVCQGICREEAKYRQ